jgi:hypothetical protein
MRRLLARHMLSTDTVGTAVGGDRVRLAAQMGWIRPNSGRGAYSTYTVTVPRVRRARRRNTGRRAAPAVAG